MAQKPPRTLNLLEETEKPTSTWDKIYQWVSSIGRYVIIAVELAVLIMFVSRFALDWRNNDLKDEIEVKIQMLKAQSEIEMELRRVQSALNNFSLMIGDQEVLSAQTKKIFEEIPEEVEVEGFSISQNAITLDCRAPTYEIVGELEEKLHENSDYMSIKVSLSKPGSEESEVEFEVNIQFETEG